MERVNHLIYSFHSSTSKLNGSPYSLDIEKRESLVKNNTLILKQLSKNIKSTKVGRD